MRVALDTNVLAYAEGVGDRARKRMALELLERLPLSSVVIPVQVLGELFRVLVRKRGMKPAEARNAILYWRNAFSNLSDTSAEVLLAAVDLAQQQVSIWDAVIICAAAEARCQLLLSEDLQDGFIYKGVKVVNPFREPRHALLEAILEPVK
ncbi:MAG: PIN domain-containing protein [Acidobacteriota bacterium]